MVTICLFFLVFFLVFFLSFFLPFLGSVLNETTRVFAFYKTFQFADSVEFGSNYVPLLPGELIPEIWVLFVYVKNLAPLAEVNN